MASITKPRLRYFDMLKGVAIFLVVMGHVLAFCVREIDCAAIFKFIEQIHMPIFFFISGWFCTKLNIRKRVDRLLLPMVAVSSLWVLYFPHSGLETPLNSTFSGLWSDSWKNGYWFTFVLFEIVLIYAAITPLLNRCRSVVSAGLLVAVVSFALIAIYAYSPSLVSGIVSLTFVASFFPIFMFGVLARRYRDGFMAIVHSSNCQTIAIIVLVVMLYVCSWSWEFNLTDITVIFPKILLHISLAILSIAVFESWADKAFSSESDNIAPKIASFWEYLGTQSLAIYMLHYFFLFPMAYFRPLLEAVNLTVVPLGVFAAFWALAIIGSVLLVVKLISPSKLLSLLLTGNK